MLKDKILDGAVKAAIESVQQETAERMMQALNGNAKGGTQAMDNTLAKRLQKLQAERDQLLKDCAAVLELHCYKTACVCCPFFDETNRLNPAARCKLMDEPTSWKTGIIEDDDPWPD